MIVSTKVIILRCIDFQDSSKIITALSFEHGKISLIAKGAKKPKSKLAGVIEVGNILDVNYYYKKSRSIQTLSNASILYQSLNFRKDFERAAILYSTLELVSQLVHENEENSDIFAFTNNLVRWLGESDSIHPSIFAYVQIRLAHLVGIGVIDETNEGNSVYLNISSGAIADAPDSELTYTLTDLQALFFKRALSTQSKEIFTLGLEKLELKQLIHHLDVYFKYHIEGYKDRRSDTIFDQMIQD